MIHIGAEPIDAHGALDRFTRGASGAGAIASFVGLVRGEGDAVRALTLDHYPGFTEKEIERIARGAITRFDLIDALVMHRCGTMGPGETIVLVAAAAHHRRPALEAVAFLIDYLKTDAPFWKREEGKGGARWIEPLGSDRQARAAWERPASFSESGARERAAGEKAASEKGQ